MIEFGKIKRIGQNKLLLNIYPSEYVADLASFHEEFSGKDTPVSCWKYPGGVEPLYVLEVTRCNPADHWIGRVFKGEGSRPTYAIKKKHMTPTDLFCGLVEHLIGTYKVRLPLYKSPLLALDEHGEKVQVKLFSQVNRSYEQSYVYTTSDKTLGLDILARMDTGSAYTMQFLNKPSEKGGYEWCCAIVCSATGKALYNGVISPEKGTTIPNKLYDVLRAEIQKRLKHFVEDNTVKGPLNLRN